jgi:hypothetical protein
LATLVFLVPQSYKIKEVQNFRVLLQSAGCTGPVYIHGESDYVTYANLPSIEDIIDEARDLAFNKAQDFSVTAIIFGLRAGTSVSTLS